MKQIVTLSGKGGTGKTTVSAALASHWRGRAIFVDADVDAANLHLLLRPKRNEVHPFMGGLLPTCDTLQCDGCGLCTKACRFGAMNAGRVLRISCEGCGLCALTCPTGAIQMRPRHAGDWFLGQTPYGFLLHARLLPGEGNSGKLVTVLKEEAVKVALKEHLECVLCDGPPGIGCPAMASLAGADAVLAVAEASASGLHDLARVLELAARFRIPCFAAVNKADVVPAFTAAVEEECRARGVPLLGRVPYDPTVLACMAENKPISARPAAPAAQALERLGRSLDTALERLESDQPQGHRPRLPPTAPEKPGSVAGALFD